MIYLYANNVFAYVPAHMQVHMQNQYLRVNVHCDIRSHVQICIYNIQCMHSYLDARLNATLYIVLTNTIIMLSGLQLKDVLTQRLGKGKFEIIDVTFR